MNILHKRSGRLFIEKLFILDMSLLFILLDNIFLDFVVYLNILRGGMLQHVLSLFCPPCCLPCWFMLVVHHYVTLVDGIYFHGFSLWSYAYGVILNIVMIAATCLLQAWPYTTLTELFWIFESGTWIKICAEAGIFFLVKKIQRLEKWLFQKSNSQNLQEMILASISMKQIFCFLKILTWEFFLRDFKNAFFPKNRENWSNIPK